MYKINLLPYELQRDHIFDVRKLIVGSVSALVIVGICAAYALFLYKLHIVTIAVAEAGQSLKSLQGDVVAVEEIKKQRISNEQTVLSLREILEKRIIWSKVLEEVNFSLPKDMWLVRLELAHRDLREKAPGLRAGAGAAEREASSKEPKNTPSAGLQQDAPDKRQPDTPAKPSGIPPDIPLPTPNVLVFEGYSHSVSSVGVFIHSLYLMPFFSKAILNELSEDEKTAAVRFKITVLIKDGGQ